MNITVGLKGTVEDYVNQNNTAQSVGSGSLMVFATPAMIALMEKASCVAIEEGLDEGTTSVGTMVNIEHVSATPVGAMVKVESVVTAVEGRKISFEVTAFDNAGIIGKGTHDRFVINSEKFMLKTNSKIQ